MSEALEINTYYITLIGENETVILHFTCLYIKLNSLGQTKKSLFRLSWQIDPNKQPTKKWKEKRKKKISIDTYESASECISWNI